MSSVYLIQSKSDGMIYVGQTSLHGGVKARYRSFKYPRTNHNPRPVDIALKNRGGGDFMFHDIVVGLSHEEALRWERWWIKALDAKNMEVGFNQNSGGSGSGGISEDTRRRISEKSKGRKHSAETCLKIGAIHRGLRHTDAAKLKMSVAAKRRVTTPEARANMAAGQLGRKLSVETIEKIRLANSGENSYWRRRPRSEINHRVRSGPGHPRYKLRDWTHPEHGKFTGSCSELIKAFPGQNLSMSCLSKVIRKPHQHKGWRACQPG